MRIRLRAVIIGLLFALAICAVTPFNNVYRQATLLGGGHFPLAPFYVLTWLTILVGIGRKFFRNRTLLTGGELLIVWAMMLLVSGIAYTGLARTFFINLTAPFHFATMENQWVEIIQPLLPEALYPQSAAAIEGLYNGLADGRQMGWMDIALQIPWLAWAKPLLVWGGFILVTYFVMICIVNILAHQALANERMNFPLLHVPQLMEEALDENRLGHFLGNRFLLMGMAIPVFLHLLNGLNYYYPGIPQIPTLVYAGSYFPNTGLFAGFVRLKIYFYPAFIGFAFLTSKQVSLSFWFFFLLGGLSIGLLGLFGYNIPVAALGVTFGPTLRRPEEMQMIGAFVVFFLFLFWLARSHFLDVVRQALGLNDTISQETQWISNRVSFWGVVSGSVILVLWLTHFGLPLLPALVVLFSFFMFTLVAMRVICQGGVAYFTLTAAPLDGIICLFGSQFFTSLGLLLSAVVQKVLFLDLRESLMPSLLHAKKLSHKPGNRRMILGFVLAALISGVVVSMLSMLSLCYKYGLRELSLDWATETTLSVYDKVRTLAEVPMAPNHWVLSFVAVGAVIMLIMVFCYHRIYWWPLHPIGYLTAFSSAMQILWVSFFIGWLTNAVCMRYGGVVLYKQVRFFFIGLIIGDFLMGGSWAIVGLFGGGNYHVLPS
ncbi:MAG: hypothetical protein HKM93_12945 [Desulfobacteraceae bacterium]|nr:hypothetical protein [Desulfobacteraceae bacterium]